MGGGFVPAALFFFVCRAVLPGRKAGKAAKFLCIIALAGKSAVLCNKGNCIIGFQQKIKAFTNAVLAKIIRNRLAGFLFKITAAFASAQANMTGNLGKGDFMRVIFLQKGKKDLKSVVFRIWNIFDITGKILPKKIP